MEDRLPRKLAAILYADVVGYSRMANENEDETHRKLKESLDLISTTVDSCSGRIISYSGDAVLAMFDAAVDAVTCATAIQHGMTEFNQDEPEERKIQFRIGVNLGDVIEDDGDIFGDGVNVAARLESLAEPGGICISGEVHGVVHKKLEERFADLGLQKIRNIAEPVQVFAWPTKANSSAESTQKTESLSLPAVAVLPFDNMSGDPEQEYFSDGLTEDIITALSYWRSFPVIARNSSFTYKGQSVRIQQVAEELGVRYVLEGSVRKAGNRIRITAQLIEGSSGHHVWADKFDRNLEDIFEVQDEITNKIAATIVPELEVFEHKRSMRTRTDNLDAWDYYVRGMETFFDATCAGNIKSKQMFRNALEHDPNYCDAWARLAWALAQDVQFNCPVDHSSAIAEAFECARKAVVLDSNSSLAHMSLGTVHIWANETAQGLAEAQMALELNPNFAHAAMAVGNRLDLVGQAHEGIEQMKRALLLNPRDPVRWHYMAYLARAYTSLGDYEMAVTWSEKATRLRSDIPEPLFRHAVILAHLDQVDEARRLLARCDSLDPEFLASKANWSPYPDPARNAQVMAGLRRHGFLA